MYFITREVSNRAVTYCLILHICIMIVLIIATWRQQGVNSKLGFGKKAQRIFFPICTWLMLFSISTPVELYLNNSDDFSLSFWTFFSKLVVVSIVVLCFFVILGSWYLMNKFPLLTHHFLSRSESCPLHVPWASHSIQGSDKRISDNDPHIPKSHLSSAPSSPACFHCPSSLHRFRINTHL